MTLGLVAGPLQMLFSVLLMQGLSLTMFRTFLNQAIPRLDPMRFQLSVGNNPNAHPMSTPAPNMDAQNLMPYLNLLAPMILQQQMHRQQNMNNLMQPIVSQLQPSAQPQMVSAQLMTQPSYQLQAPAYQVQPPSYQLANGQQMPQVIIVPQIIPQPSKGSASTNLPVQVEAPQKIPNLLWQEQDNYGQQPRITKRMLERPPKTTTRKPKVDNRAHAGAIHVQFATPRAPAGFRRFIIPPVTAQVLPDNDLTTVSPDDYYNKASTDFYDNYFVSSQSSNSVTENFDLNHSSEEKALPTTASSVDKNFVDYINVFNTILTTTASSVTTPFSDNNEMVTSAQKTTEVSDKETVVDKNLVNHKMNDTEETKVVSNSTENMRSINDLIHKDFDEYVKNISVNQIESNQSPDLYFENSKENDVENNHQFKRVCYYLLRAKDGNLPIKDIDPYICSHLIVGYASVAPNDLIVPRNPAEDPEKYREITNLKSINRKLKVMLSVGDGSGAAFSKMVSNAKSRDKFVASVLDVCDAFDFDGVDVDWEYPYFRTGSKEDKRNFVLLLKEIRREAIRRFRNDFLISATVGAPLVIAMSSYDVPLIGDAVDFVNLMSYDFNMYRWDRPYTGHHSPLYPRPTEKQYFQTLNSAWSATYWANKGMPLHKIVLGVPTYARTYSLVVPVSQGLDVPVTGPGLGGGKLNYTAVCHFLSSGATREFDIYSQVPFAYKNFDWVAYESEISAALKAQWVVKAHMGGVMTFALNFDDIKGDCRRDGKRFPLQKAISNLLELSSIKSYRDSNHSPALTQFISRKLTR